jgi:magnesium-transporting ATPase (P-type)
VSISAAQRCLCLCMATLTEISPCFFLSCKANARKKPAKTGHGPNSSSFLCSSMYFCIVLYCLFCVVLFIVCMYMCTVLLSTGGYTIAFKYIISYHISYGIISYFILYIISYIVSYHISHHIIDELLPAFQEELRDL